MSGLFVTGLWIKLQPDNVATVWDVGGFFHHQIS
jgi:hypothetical protein